MAPGLTYRTSQIPVFFITQVIRTFQTGLPAESEEIFIRIGNIPDSGPYLELPRMKRLARGTT